MNLQDVIYLGQFLGMGCYQRSVRAELAPFGRDVSPDEVDSLQYEPDLLQAVSVYKDPKLDNPSLLSKIRNPKSLRSKIVEMAQLETMPRIFLHGLEADYPYKMFGCCLRFRKADKWGTIHERFDIHAFADDPVNKRFQACKELMQILCYKNGDKEAVKDEKEFREALRDSEKFKSFFNDTLVNAAKDWQDNDLQCQELNSETAAFYCAVESMLLLTRDSVKFNHILAGEDRAGVSSTVPWSDKTIEKLSKAFFVPIEVVRHVMAFGFSHDKHTCETYREFTRVIRAQAEAAIAEAAMRQVVMARAAVVQTAMP